uniref:Uncharacterized protein n=1 Tax=Myoviridae sp. ctshb19 TaxID=2825194 RepID=A0A8S5UGL8_9CAUD|nr:MAG TPA: hypothetical protein [Myoviridae sp. ctshb19]
MILVRITGLRHDACNSTLTQFGKFRFPSYQPAMTSSI